MIGLAIAAAVMAAVVAVGLRRLRRARLRRAAGRRAGASLELAIPIRDFGEIDEVVAQRWCHCGGYLERQGEGTRDAGGRRYRVARLCCQECEAVTEVFFETTEALH